MKWVVGLTKYYKMKKAKLSEPESYVGGARRGVKPRVPKANPTALDLLSGRQWEARYGNTWDAEIDIAMGKGEEAKVNVLHMVEKIISGGNRLFADTLYAGMWVMVMDYLSAFWEGATQEYLKEQGFGEHVLGPRGTTNTGTRWATRRCSNAPELMPLELKLFSDWEHGMDMNCAIS